MEAVELIMLRILLRVLKAVLLVFMWMKYALEKNTCVEALGSFADQRIAECSKPRTIEETMYYTFSLDLSYIILLTCTCSMPLIK